MTRTDIPRAVPADTMTLAPDLTVHRLGYGTMQLTGPGVWGEPRDRRAAIRVLRRAVELGIDLIDTADAYGPFVAEELVREALHPYDGVTVATKGGQVRTGPGGWQPVGLPEYLRQCVEMSLRRLGVERIELYQLHRIDPRVPLAEQIGVLRDLRAEGKIGHIGLSEVDVEQLEAARAIVEIVSVQNLFNLSDRHSEPLLKHCEREGIGFIPWFPIGNRELARPDGPLAALADQLGAAPAQLALAWLLHRSPVLLPIPGTSTLEHLEQNVAAASIELTAEQIAVLEGSLSGRQ
jgi:aryl-alcohol dehydrogenase-like predicted oxidoreductase